MSLPASPNGKLAASYVLALSLALCIWNLVWATPAPTDSQPDDQAKSSSASSGEVYQPPIAPASNEGEKAISRFQVPAGMKVELFAAEPLLANPVTFCLDHKGRAFVAETFRIKHGVEDIRDDHMDWLDDDLAAQTVEDRLAYFKKHLGDNIKRFTTEHERVRLVEDRDGDGKADHATVFADGFNDVLDGIGAGLLAYRGDIFYACIPHLWRLRDQDGDGRSDQKDSLHYGYGVRVSFYGHDLHGLTIGPDGRLYFSIGDRGCNVTAGDRKIVNPESGCVLRCNLDGSDLKLFATGLRNPQELAFDDYGNLFTGDNTGDYGDKARWVHVVEGGDSGWRQPYQFSHALGPWNREKLWHLQHEGQAAYIIPPVAHVGAGPSGLVYYPGTGLPEKYRGSFFLVDFRGGASASGVRNIRLNPKGAGFEVAQDEQFLWSVLATDVDFGPDGAMYVLDWVEGWVGTGRGRIYRLTDPESMNSAPVQEVKRLLNEGLAKHSNEQLVEFLSHVDRRIRQEAQFELARRGAVTEFQNTALTSPSTLARLHAIWGLGQITRQNHGIATLMDVARRLMTHADPEVRAQVVKTLGDSAPAGVGLVVPLLKDDSPRVRYLTAIALSKAKQVDYFDQVVEMVLENDDHDPILRHAGAMALSAAPGGAKRLAGLVNDPSRSVRLAAVLALRRLASPEVASFLDDQDPLVALEAARAIHDLPIANALPKLASRIDRPIIGSAEQQDAFARRVLNANNRLGSAEHAEALAKFVSNASTLIADGRTAEAMRVEAIQLLSEWDHPSSRDRVLNVWRPLPPRNRELAAAAVRSHVNEWFAGSDQVCSAATEVAAKLGIAEAAPALMQLVNDKARPADLRAAALRSIEQLDSAKASDVLEALIADEHMTLRIEGKRLLAKLRPQDAVSVLRDTVERGEIEERQEALAVLGGLNVPGVASILESAMNGLLDGSIPAELRLDVLEAAAKHDSPELKRQLAQFQESRSKSDPLADYREVLAGGNAARGKHVFFNKAETSCLRCHRVKREGGEVGPDLTRIAATLAKKLEKSELVREYLLEAIVQPNSRIAEGFETVIITTDAGLSHTGIVQKKDGVNVHLITTDGKKIAIPIKSIEEMTVGASAMPADMTKHLSKRELRDLIEFLVGLKK